MNKYEILLIFKPSFEAESMDSLLAQVETTLTAAGGTILRSDRFGRKKLAYRIQKLREGLMAVVAVDLPPAAIKDLTFNLKLNDELIRFLILRHDALDVEKPFLVTPVTGREPREPGGRGGRSGPGGRFGGREGGGGGRFGDREGGGGGGRFGDREGGGGGGGRFGGREGGFQSGGPARFGPPREGGYVRPEPGAAAAAPQSFES